MPFNGVVAAPRLEPSKFGLLSVAHVTEHAASDEHWVGGFDFESDGCSLTANILDVCGADVDNNSVADGTGALRFVKYAPFGIEVIDACSAMGVLGQDRFAKVKRQLEAVTPKAVEFELWTGSTAIENSNDNPYLAKSLGVVAIDANPISPRIGLALLEEAIGECGAGLRGVVHMPRAVASILSDYIYREEDETFGHTILTTALGTPVAAGAGYPGTGPGSAAQVGDQYWMYATGPVAVHLGASEVVNETLGQGFDASLNDMIVKAVRPAAAYFYPCCHFAVKVDLSLA